jgi:hypothetical protein
LPSNARAAGYTIKLATATTFQISHDKGRTFSPTTFATGTNVALDDGVTRVTFGGTQTAGAIYGTFYVSYPFLRASGARMCVSCHRDRDQRHYNVEGTGTVPGTGQGVVLATTYFSHPVAETLNANGAGYDASSATSILDANGGYQGGTGAWAPDGNKWNDLVVGSDGSVNCLTCHHPHNADSNSNTNHSW